jgi:hypothetical protein
MNRKKKLYAQHAVIKPPPFKSKSDSALKQTKTPDGAFFRAD